jgi:branched-chain amino acid transport system ATP-binding protein
MSLLELRDVNKSFGGLPAVSMMSFSVEAGDIVGVFGPNGSGKTTLLNLIAGTAEATSGKILWKGDDITGRRPYQVAQLGICKTFQNPQLFPELTVREHLEIATHLHLKRSFGIRRVLQLAGAGADRESSTVVADTLRLCRLDEHACQPVSALSYGAEKMVGVAMALICQPQLLLLDEPTSGLGQDDAINLEVILRGVNASGITMCVIDHRVSFLSRLAPKAIALHHGTLISSGDMTAVLRDPAVKLAYFGNDRA